MWCRNCNIELNDKKCPICGSDAVEDIPVTIYWCKSCKVPVLQEVAQADKGICPRCGNRMRRMASDIRPVFPEERLLMEILLGYEPNEHIDKSVWAVNSRYYIDGKSVPIPTGIFETADADTIAKRLEESKSANNYLFFDEMIGRFVEANSVRLDYLKDEACRFVN